jgi:hypothetical protein
MDKILIPLIDGIISGNIVIVAIVAAVAVIFNISKIADFIDSRKRIKISKLEEAIINPHVNGITKQHLEKMIENEYFKNITGITLEKDMRETLLEVHKSSKGEIRFDHFKRAIPYLRYKDSNLSIEVSKWSRFCYYVNLFVGLLFICGGFVFLITTILMIKSTIVSKLSMFGLAILLLLFGLLIALQSLPIRSADYVKQQIKKNGQECT